MNIDVGALRDLMQERGIDFESAAKAVEESLLAAYHKLDGAKKHARALLDRKNGKATILAREILSQKDNPNPKDEHDTIIYELGEEYDDTPSDFTRIAAAAARQKILQMVNQAEDFNKFGDYKNKKGQIISGVVKPFEVTSERAGR